MIAGALTDTVTGVMRREQWDRAYASSDLRWSIQPHRDVEEQLACVEPGYAVELGCGDGRQAIWLASLGWRVTAVDFSRVAVGRGRKVAESHGLTVDWVVADVLRYELPGAVDLVMIVYLHIDPDGLASVLTKATAALAPAGRLLVVGWDRLNATNRTGGPPARTLYDIEDLASATRGLHVLRADQVPQAGSPDAVDTLFYATRPRSA